MQLVRDRNPTASILLGVAAIQLVVGLVGLFVNRVNPDMDVPQLKWVLYSFQRGTFSWVDWTLAFSAVVYLALSLIAGWRRTPAAFLGAGLYAVLLTVQAFYGVGTLTTGLITKIPVAALLLSAVALGMRHATPDRLPPK